MRRAGTARLSRRRAGNGELSMQRVVDRALLDVSKPPAVEAKPAQRPRSGRRAQTQLPLPESENGVVGSAM
jgi:hypothetical protein